MLMLEGFDLTARIVPLVLLSGAASVYENASLCRSDGTRILCSSSIKQKKFGFRHYDCRDCFLQENDSKNNLTLSLYTNLRGGGWSMILLSRKEEKHRNSTIQNLIVAGFQGWWSVILRSGDEMQLDIKQYFARRRASIENKGLHISGIISSQMDALTGPFLGTRVFKLPNPMYYSLMDQKRYDS